VRRAELAKLAEQLATLLRQRLAIASTVVVDGAPGPDVRGSDAVVRVASDVGGGTYDGGTWNLSIAVDGALRTDGTPITVSFVMLEHEISGQCDGWTLELAGLGDDASAAAIELFHPRQRRGPWNDHVTPRLVVDGRVTKPWT
jgi:hypothetical protein